MLQVPESLLFVSNFVAQQMNSVGNALIISATMLSPKRFAVSVDVLLLALIKKSTDMNRPCMHFSSYRLSRDRIVFLCVRFPHLPRCLCCFHNLLPSVHLLYTSSFFRGASLDVLDITIMSFFTLNAHLAFRTSLPPLFPQLCLTTSRRFSLMDTKTFYISFLLIAKPVKTTEAAAPSII